MLEEKAGRQFKDDMTPAKASGIRAAKIEAKSYLTRKKEKRIRLPSKRKKINT
jgi:hypothetical protein